MSASLLHSYRSKKDAPVEQVNLIVCDECLADLRRAGAWGITSEYVPPAEWPERCGFDYCNARLRPDVGVRSGRERMRT